MNIKLNLATAVRLLITAVVAAASGVDQAARSVAGQISGEYMRDLVAKLSADELEGRGTAAPGGEKAGDFLAAELKALGYEPAGPDGAWKQSFDIIGIKGNVPKEWSFKSKDGKPLVLKYWDQYLAGSGAQSAHAELKDAEVVFVGYGIQAPEYKWDDFKGMDLKGKVLIMLNNDPDWDPKLFAGNTRLYYGRYSYKYESAARQGAAAALVIHTTPSAGYPFQVLQSGAAGEQFELPATGEPLLQIKGWITEDGARQLAAFGGQDLAKLMEAARSPGFKPVSLGVSTSFAIESEVQKRQTFNVYGLLRGSDPVLREEVVIYSAHHDHLGISTPDAEGDAIYNGAMDNASGMAQLFAIAKAFKALPTPPRRSIMILFVGAEERGLLGSRYFAEHPTFAPGRIAANMNYDGGTIWGPTRDIIFIGKGKSTLDPILERYAGEQKRVVTPDQFPDRGFYYRSDQFSFARIGVPAMYLDSGTDVIGKPEGWGKEKAEEYTAKCYHQPCDELGDDWNFDGMVQDAALGFFVGLEVANADAMPEWVPGDEFEATRKAALKALPKSP